MKRHILIILCLIGALCCPLSRPLFALAADDERQVVATGVGMTEDDAKRQAYRNAIQSVVGTLVVAKTLVENNTLVSDKVLSHSDGYITKVEQLGKTVAREGGLMEVTMLVTVKSQQLKEKLQDEKITVAEMDGSHLMDVAAAKEEHTKQAKDAAAIMAEAIKESGLPASVIATAANIGEAEVATESGGASTMTVPITVSVNMDAYRKVIGGLKKTLTDLGFKGDTLTLSLSSSSKGADIKLTGSAWDDFKEKFWEEPTSILIICEMYSLESKQARLTFFLRCPRRC